MKMLIAAFLLAATPAIAQDCQIINGALNSGNGSVTGQSYGNQLYVQQWNNWNTLWGEPISVMGRPAQRTENKTYLYNGKVCQQYGGQLNCN